MVNNDLAPMLQDESERLQQIAANQALQSATGAAGKWANWGKKKGGAAGISNL